MVNISFILKNNPEGTELYSPIIGKCYLSAIDSNHIIVNDDNDYTYWFDVYGRYYINQDNYSTECLLFPSETKKVWNASYDFKPFDKVIGKRMTWQIDLFDYYNPIDSYPFHCFRYEYEQCVPYIEENFKLIGTRDEFIS